MQYVFIFETSYPIAFKIVAFCCILIDGSDNYYYTDVTPLKAKNMLLHHETFKFNCSNCNNGVLPLSL